MHPGLTAGTSGQPFRLLSGAFLASVTVHAIAGGLLLSQWHHAIKPVPEPRPLQVMLLKTSPPVPILPAPAPTPAVAPAPDPVESVEPVQPTPDPTPEIEPIAEAPPTAVEIEPAPVEPVQSAPDPTPEAESVLEAPPSEVAAAPAELQVKQPQPVQVKKIKPKAPTKVARLKKKEKARLPVEEPPARDTVAEPDSKASDDAPRDPPTGNIANPVSPAPAAEPQPPATIAAANSTTLPAATAGPPVPPHFEVAYLDNPKPAYPLAARRLKLEGTVVLRVMVKASGLPETVALGKSSGAAILDEAALVAVKSWRFVPAHQGELAIDHWVDVPIRFTLVDAGNR